MMNYSNGPGTRSGERAGSAAPARPADPAGAPEPAVRARGLTVVRGARTVLRGLDFGIAAGSVTGLLGPSGCGKSTLMRALVGAQAKVDGTLTVLGHPAGHPDLRSRVGYVTQAPSVYADLTIRQNLEYFSTVLDPRAGRAARRSGIERTLADVDLTDHADALVDRLSGGQRSRVSLAVALLGTPELLVLDEPTVGLDPVLRRDLWGLFHRLAAERGTTLLVSSHVMDEAERCHRLLLLRDGALLADDTPDALRSRTGAGTVEDAFLRLVDQAEESDRADRADRVGGSDRADRTASGDRTASADRTPSGDRTDPADQLDPAGESGAAREETDR